MGEVYGGLKLRTPGFKRNLYGRSSSYGRWSVDVFGTDAQACTVCLGRDQRPTDALRLWDLRCPTLYRCARKVFVREKEPCACISECHSLRSADVASLMLRFVQICLSIVQTEALTLLKLRCPGLIQMCRDESHLHDFVRAERRPARLKK